jgi:hypothetical protein
MVYKTFVQAIPLGVSRARLGKVAAHHPQRPRLTTRFPGIRGPTLKPCNESVRLQSPPHKDPFGLSGSPPR